MMTVKDSTIAVCYHITPMENELSIVETGVDPAFSKGKQTVSWWVEKPAVGYVLAHLSALKKLPADEFIIFRGIMDLCELRRTKWPMVYTCDHVHEAYLPQGVTVFLEIATFGRLIYPRKQG